MTDQKDTHFYDIFMSHLLGTNLTFHEDMLLKEKLASEYATITHRYSKSDTKHSFVDYQLATAYLAGFQTALEMAADIADEYSYREGTKGPSMEIGESIRRLGEEEVE